MAMQVPETDTEDLKVAGHSLPSQESRDKVTGHAMYTDDYTFPGQLEAATLRAGVPHARITRLDTSKAKALPGVHAVLTHEDVPAAPGPRLAASDFPRV